MIHAALFAVALAAPPQDVAPTSDIPDPLASLAPTGASVLVRFASVDRFEAAFRALDGALAPDDRTEPLDALRTLVPVDAEFLRRDLPILIGIDAAGAGSRTYVVPVHDVRKFKNWLVEELSVQSAASEGDYVGFNIGSSYERGGSPLIEGLGEGAVSVGADLGPLLASYGALLEAGSSEVRTALEANSPGGTDLGSLVGLYSSLVKDLRASATTMTLTMDVANGVLSVDSSVTIRGGSPMAKVASDSRATFGDQLFLVPGYAAHAVTGFDFERVLANDGLFEALLTTAPPGLATTLRGAIADFRALAGDLGPVQSMSFDFGGEENSFRAVSVIHKQLEAEDVRADYLGILDSTTGAGIEGVEDLGDAHGGSLSFARRRIRYDADAFITEDMAPESREAIRRALSDVTVAVAERERDVVLVVGRADTDLSAIAKELAEPAIASQSMARAFEDVRATTPCMVATMDLAALIDGARALGGGAQVDAETTERIPLTLYGVAFDDRWAFGFDVGIAGLGRLAAMAR